MASNCSALDLLKLGDEGREKPFLNKIWPELLGVTFGIGLGCLLNFGTRRPMLSGIQKHILGAILLTGTFKYVSEKRDDYYAERDAILMHYVELHPEDFPTKERKRLADVFEPWIPIR